MAQVNSNKQLKISKNSNASSATPMGARAPEDLMFARINKNESDVLDIVQVVRACNGFKLVPDDKSLDNLLRSRLVGKVMTLANMDNGFRTGSSKLTVGSRTAVASDLVDSTKSERKQLYDLSTLKLGDGIKLLNDMWNIYSVAAIATIRSVDARDALPGISLSEWKYKLLVDNLELIGAEIEIIDSSNAQLIGVRGTVLREGENVLEIITHGKGVQKTIPKSVVSFSFISDNDFLRRIVIFGPDLCGVGRSGSIYRDSPTDLRFRARNPLTYG